MIQMRIYTIWLDCCLTTNLCASGCLTQVMALGSELASIRKFGGNSVLREAVTYCPSICSIKKWTLIKCMALRWRSIVRAILLQVIDAQKSGTFPWLPDGSPTPLDHLRPTRLDLDSAPSNTSRRVCSVAWSRLSRCRNHQNQRNITSPVRGAAVRGRIHHQPEMANTLPS